jgi:hypothetical protein
MPSSTLFGAAHDSSLILPVWWFIVHYVSGKAYQGVHANVYALSERAISWSA